MKYTIEELIVIILLIISVGFNVGLVMKVSEEVAEPESTFTKISKGVDMKHEARITGYNTLEIFHPTKDYKLEIEFFSEDRFAEDEAEDRAWRIAFADDHRSGYYSVKAYYMGDEIVEWVDGTKQVNTRWMCKGELD